MPYTVLFVILVMAMIYLLTKRMPVLYPGFIGVFIVLLLGNLIGNARAKSNFLEIGFDGDQFYLRSSYDIAYKTNLKFYPLQYSNATIQGNSIMLNYIEQTIEIRRSEWENWNEIGQELGLAYF